MFLFNFYIDDSNNLRNILVGEISKENEKELGFDMNNIGEGDKLALINDAKGPMVVYHDIRRIRNGNIVNIYDNDNLLVSMEYETNGGYLKRSTGREKLLFNKEKIRMVKFNKSGSITCNFACEDKTYNNDDRVIHIANKTSKKSKTLRTSNMYERTNVAIEELLYNMDTITQRFKCNHEYFPENKYQTISYMIDSDRKEIFEELLGIVLKAAEKYTIFLNFERKN